MTGQTKLVGHSSKRAMPEPIPDTPEKIARAPLGAEAIRRAPGTSAICTTSTELRTRPRPRPQQMR